MINLLIGALLLFPPGAGPDCAATFTAPEADIYYVQAGDGVRLVDLAAGESHTFWTSEPHQHWAVWTAIVVDPTINPAFGANPGVLVASGRFCATVPTVEVDTDLVKISETRDNGEAPTARFPLADVTRVSEPYLSAGVRPL